jgi:hypothetical protein
VTKIEKLRKKPVEVETMLWDGTSDTAEAIQDWTGETSNEGESAFLLPDEVAGVVEHAQLYVAHNKDWCSLPVGYRVAKELDGSGFYPLSPEGAAAGYEMVDEHSFTEKSCLLHDGPHRRHTWSCSTPECAGHVCPGSDRD